MFTTNLLEDTNARRIADTVGRYSLLEYTKDLSVTPSSAILSYFASKMNVRKRQVIADLNNNGGVIIQSGAMQEMIGKIKASTNVNGAGDLMKKFVGSKVTKESTIKPCYTGEGLLVLEPTYKFILFEDMADWEDGLVLEDGLFLACDDSIDMKVTSRKSVSSAVLGGEGLFSLTLYGEGTVVLESPVPADELIVVDLKNDELKIDGSMAVGWSANLDFTVERTTKTLVGSAASGEGLVNVYRGTGRVLIAPVMEGNLYSRPPVTDTTSINVKLNR